MFPEQVAVQNQLKKKLEEIQKVNPRYSLRAYSNKLGLHAGTLSSILNGKRRISRKFAANILKKLDLPLQIKSEVFSLFPTKNPPTHQKLELKTKHFSIVAKWKTSIEPDKLKQANELFRKLQSELSKLFNRSTDQE